MLFSFNISKRVSSSISLSSKPNFDLVEKIVYSFIVLIKDSSLFVNIRFSLLILFPIFHLPEYQSIESPILSNRH